MLGVANIEALVFYVFSSVLVFAATSVVVSKHPVRAVLFLVLAFFSASALWLLTGAEFLALALVLVYVGAVMVLFLFVVMMLDVDIAAVREGFIHYLPLGLLVALLVMAELIWVFTQGDIGLSTVAGNTGWEEARGIRALGTALFTEYVYPFELAGVLLLVAIVAAISLTFRGQVARKTQNPAQQANVRREDRVRLVKMPSEKPQ